MADQPQIGSNSGKPSPRGVPLWVALAALLGLAVVAGGVLVFLMRQASNDKAKLEAKMAAWQLEQGKVEIAKQKAEEQAKLAVARSRQTDALAQVRQATNVIGQLLKGLQELDRDATALRTSDAGKQAAKFPDLVLLARRLYDVDLKAVAPQSTAISKLEGERRLENQLVSSAGTVFEPDATFTTTAQSDTLWANQELAKIQQIRSVLTTLISEAKIKIPPPDSTSSVTLEAAIAALNQSEAAARERVIVAKTTDANVAANTVVAAAEAEKILKEAKAKADAIVAEANAQVAKQAQEAKVREAQLQIDASKAKVAVDQAAEEAKKVQLRARLTDPAVLSQLSPFTTPGYLQMDGRNSYEKRPLSYNGLLQHGALSQDDAGLTRIVRVMGNGNDKVRPRARLSVGWKSNTEEHERVVAIQRLLIELGPTMVEQGLLDP